MTPTVSVAAHNEPLCCSPCLAEEDELLEVEDAETGVAIGDVGLYVTPFAEAATSNTDPPPYS